MHSRMSWLGRASRQVEINGRLASCRTVQEVETVFAKSAHGGHFNLVNCVTALHRLAHVTPKGSSSANHRGRRKLDASLAVRLHDRLIFALTAEVQRRRASAQWTVTETLPPEFTDMCGWFLFLRKVPLV